MKFLIKNIQIITEADHLPDAALLVEDGKISEIYTSPQELNISDSAEIINGEGKLLIPGMIDVHIHGARGLDMMDGTVESVEEVSRSCASAGCTTFLATSVTSSLERLFSMIEAVKKVIGKEPGAKIAGMHLEGPYLHPNKKGMQNEAFLRHPDIPEMKKILEVGGDLIKMVTIAPELPGGFELVSFLKEKGIIVAIAHSEANYDEAKNAFSLGVSHITHCFNAMRPIHQRDPGLILAAFEEEKVSLQAIVDDVHLHPAIVRLMHRIKGPDKMVLVTDAMQAMGMGDGKYNFGGHEVEVKNGVATLNDGTLASSTVTMNEALKKTINCGIPLPEAVKMATQTPAGILNLSEKGRIRKGADADLVLMDHNFEIIWTMIEGNIFQN
ncbi:N-acetylglucosamine-6-phosphate deacetylase [soil metagenome]